jgi:hypothetical protein
MTITPPWLEGNPQAATEQTVAEPAAGRWVKGMASPNKAGRPRGIVDRRSKLAERMLADADGIIAVMSAKALEGDSGAAHLILGRVLPALRSTHEMVQFPFDATAPVTDQIEAVLTAIASGAVSADVGQTIIAALGTLADARAVADLESRIVTLEAKEVR